MKRIHFFELEDQSWCPAFLREGVTDFLQFAVIRFHLYKRITVRFRSALRKSGKNRIIDLCAGGGGPWRTLIPDLLNQQDCPNFNIHLTDYFPNRSAFESLRLMYPEVVSYSPDPVSARSVPSSEEGFRTLFSSFHHFAPTDAREILRNAIEQQQPIAIFESTQRHPLLLLYMLLTPLLVWLATPFMGPLRISRLFFTYAIPIIPLVVMFDGIVSCLRTYTPSELSQLIASIDKAKNYDWETGVETLRGLPIGITYLIGLPARTSTS